MIKATNAELSTLHGILTRLEWVEREYLDLSDKLRESLNEEFEPENRFMPLLRSLMTTAEDMVKIAEERKPIKDEFYQPSEEELRRYTKALDKITRLGLLNLPLETIALLKTTRDFKKKLLLLEKIAEGQEV